MHCHTETDIALLGYAISLETTGRYKRKTDPRREQGFVEQRKTRQTSTGQTSTGQPVSSQQTTGQTEK